MSDPNYYLNRDARESARLIAQHEWLKQLVGFNLHPTIPTIDHSNNKDSPSTLRIADVATGTAIWLVDLAQTLPKETELYGFDISSAQFPLPEHRPPNLQLHEHNVTKPFPPEYDGTFDIVAVRLITAGLRGGSEDWDAAVRNVEALLKPGGYMQWIEPIHSSLQVFNALPGAPNSSTRKAVFYFLTAYQKTLYPGPLQLPELCQKHGLEEVALEVFPSDHFHDKEKVRGQGRLFLSGAIGAMMGSIVDEERGVTKEMVEGVVKWAMEELEGEGLFLRSEMQVFIGRRPMKVE